MRHGRLTARLKAKHPVAFDDWGITSLVIARLSNQVNRRCAAARPAVPDTDAVSAVHGAEARTNLVDEFPPTDSDAYAAEVLGSVLMNSVQICAAGF
jgi:hypothetical protein